MSDKPEITVLLPVYNADKFLNEAINSILDQSYKNFEFLIINDGSTDRSESIINSYANKDARIKVISRENRGFVATLNEGLKKARGNIIVRMDADDISLPERIDRQYAFLRENKDHAVVGCQVRTISENGVEGDVDPRPTTSDNVKLFLGYGCAVSGPTAAFRKDSVIAAGGFRESGYPAEDYDCWVRILNKDSTKKIANLPEVMYLYRENSEGISLTNKVKQIEKTIEIGTRYRKWAIDTKQKFLSESVHVGWFGDVNHVDGENKEQLKRIYYAIQTWFRNDYGDRYITKAILKSKLMYYTKKYNPENLPYVYSQPLSHSFPQE